MPAELLSPARETFALPGNVRAWTTDRLCGSFGLGSDEPVGAVMERWTALQDELAELGVRRLATAVQVHGAAVAEHGEGWHGWLRLRDVDGHLSTTPGTALAVTVADCTPVFVAHPAGAILALHAGWRGTALRIVDAGLDALARRGYPPDECSVYLGPAICGPCYEVGPDVLSAVSGKRHAGKGHVDLRAVLAEQAESRGVREIMTSDACTRCHNTRFFSHRAGDAGRQLGVIALLPNE